MSKRDKILADWINQRQPNVTVETVEAILKHSFGSSFTKPAGARSHQLRVSHPALFGHPHFVGGTLSVPVSGGQTVKAIYLKRIAEAVALVKEAEQKKAEQDENSTTENKQQDALPCRSERCGLLSLAAVPPGCQPRSRC